MAKRPPKDKATPTLSLKIETSDSNRPNVTADEFLSTAAKWLKSLETFAEGQGKHVKWEIVDLRKSSALIQVSPVVIKTGRSQGSFSIAPMSLGPALQKSTQRSLF